MSLQDFGGAGARLALDVDHVFDGDGNATEKFAVFCDTASVDRVSLRERILGIEPKIGLQFTVNGLDAAEQRLCRLAGGNVPPPQLLAELMNRQGVKAHSTIFGTM